MKTVGTMPHAQLLALVAQIKAALPAVAAVTVDEGDDSLVINTVKGKILSAVWKSKSACHVMAVPGLINVKRH